MSGHLVPDGIRHLDPLLSMTSRAPGGPFPAVASVNVDVVERVLEALEIVAPVDESELPNDLLVGWSFTAEWLAEAMPTLDAITTSALTERLREQLGDPPPALVDAIGRFWVRWLVESLLWTLLTGLGAQEGERFFQVAERRVPQAEPVVAREMLRTLAAVAGPPAIPLLSRFATMSGLHPDVREQAELELRLLRDA